MNETEDQSFPPLHVNTDPRVIKRVSKWGIALYSVQTIAAGAVAVAIAAVSAASVLLPPSAIMGAIALVGFFSAMHSAYTLGLRSEPRKAMTIDGLGIHAIVAGKALHLPWSVISSARMRQVGRHRVLTLALVPGTTPSSPGVASELPPRQFGYLAKRGFQVGSAGVDVPIQTIADAASAFTNRRLQLG